MDIKKAIEKRIEERMRKYEYVNCVICSQEFSRGKGSKRQTCSHKCSVENRKLMFPGLQRKYRQIKKQKHLCLNCGKKVKSITKYPARCESCLVKNRKQ